MTIRIKILIVLFNLSGIVGLFSQSSDSFNSIRDTSQLQLAIKSMISELDSTNTVDLDQVDYLAETSLLLKDTTTFFKLCTHLCSNYFEENELPIEGIDFLNKKQRLLENRENKYGDFYNTYGNFYLSLDFHLEALDYYLKSLQWHEKYKPEYTSVPLANISWVYFENKDFENALHYIKLSLDVSLKLKDEEDRLISAAWDYADLGLAYHKLGENQKAETSIDKSLETVQEYVKKYGTEDPIYFKVLRDAINFYTETSNYAECEALIKAGEKVCNNFKDCLSLSRVSFDLEKNIYYLKTGAIDKALDVKTMKQYYSKYGEKELLLYAIEYYSKVKDIDNLILNYDSLEALNDSILVGSRTISYSNIQDKYITEQLTEQNKELTQNIGNRNKILFIVLSILTLLISLFILQVLNNRRYKSLNQELNIKKLDLEKTNKELATTYEELERFTFITAHDLKTPIREIISFSGLLDKKVYSLKDKIMNDYVSHIINGGVRLNNLVDDSLEYFEASKSGFVLVNENVDLNKILDKLESSFSTFLKEKNAKIERIGHLPIIKSDPSSVFTLFKKTIENGIIYNEADIPTIKVSVQEGSDFYKISIEDNGIGIEEEYREKIFTMFYRLQNKKDYHGSGLGLSICKRLVNRLNGEIYFNSPKNGGSIVEIRLPKKSSF